MNSKISRRRTRGARASSQGSRLSRPRKSQNITTRKPFRNRRTSTKTKINSKSKLNERRRLKIQNLNKEFQNTELKKLFEPYGKLIRCGIHFNKMGESTGIADIEFSKHEECEEAISKLDNADIDGVKVRVKYADFGPRTSRRTTSLSNRRRNVREINRENRRNRTSNKRAVRKVREKDSKTTSSSRVTRRRRAFRRVLGRKKK